MLLSSSGGSRTAPGPAAGVLAITADRQPVDVLVSADGRLRVPVEPYADCSGRTQLSYHTAYIDVCGSVPYFGAHDVDWLFAPLLTMSWDSTLTYYDGQGAPHRYRLVASHLVPIRSGRANLPPPVPGSAAQFGTCTDATGKTLHVFDAVAG
jgi:hypothetical protein